MRSLKQIEASRVNGAKSKGPVTAAGKQRSSQNSIRHGLASKVVLLANESREEYDRVLNAYIARYRPADEPERDLVGDIVAARWRLNRTLALEAASFDHEMDRQSAAIDQDYEVIDEETRCALALKALTDFAIETARKLGTSQQISATIAARFHTHRITSGRCRRAAPLGRNAKARSVD